LRELFPSETPSTFRRAKPARASTRVLSSSEGRQGAGMQYQISSLHSNTKEPGFSHTGGWGGMRGEEFKFIKIKQKY